MYIYMEILPVLKLVLFFFSSVTGSNIWCVFALISDPAFCSGLMRLMPSQMFMHQCLHGLSVNHNGI